MVHVTGIKWKRNRIYQLLFIFCLSNTIYGQKSIVLNSPDGNIRFHFYIEKGNTFYKIDYNKKSLLSSSKLQVNFNQGGYLENLKIQEAPQFSTIEDNYDLVVGKTKKVFIRSNQVIISLAETTKEKRKLNMQVRVFNDGVAFRYLFPKQHQDSSFILYDEQTSFNFRIDPMAKVLERENYTTSHEGLYTTKLLSQIKGDTLIDLPALFEIPNEAYVGITEAALLDYAGMYLIKRKSVLQSSLSPLPNKPELKVKAQLPHASPWRVLLINKRMGALIESNIITSLAPPQKITDVSWIKTGLSTFPWWNGTVVPDSVKGGNNFETNKYYIDFCAANHILYHSVVEYGGHEWYQNEGSDFYQPTRHFDVTKTVPGLDMKQICDYAKTKGVGIRVWVHWKALYPKLDTALAVFEQWGIKGMMVDFMDRDDQEMVNIQTAILEKAAAHHLHIQFHGAYKNTGLNRTYPNEFTREGSLNYEHYKWDKDVTPNHDLDIVFTRMLAGSTDYHLGAFDAKTMEDFVPRNRLPFAMGTRCHMLGMYVVLENYQGMLCDFPVRYMGEPGFEVLQQMPVVWDETKVLDAKPNQYITIARKHQNDWYVGTINNLTEKEIKIDLDFLPKGKFDAIVYSDHFEIPFNPNHLHKDNWLVDNTTKINLHLAAGGGSVIIIHLKKTPS